MCAGNSAFVKYWKNDPFLTRRPIESWFAYAVQDIAPGYFLANALESVVGKGIKDNLWAWYPGEGKEIHKVGEVSLHRTWPLLSLFGSPQCLNEPLTGLRGQCFEGGVQEATILTS